MTNTPIKRPQRPIYLADLFFHFRVFSEYVFSAEGTLRRIEEAERPTSTNVPWTPDKNRAKHQRAYERLQLRNGLAFYLFDRFLHDENNRLENVLVEAEAGQFLPVGQTVFTKIGDLDFGRVDHWRDICAGWEREKNKAANTDEEPENKFYIFFDERELAEAANENDVVEWFHLDTARQRLLEIAGQYGASYPLLDTTLWTVKDLNSLENGFGVQDKEELECIVAARAQMTPYSELPLWFRGTKPTKKHMRDMLGNMPRLNDNYITALAHELHDHYRRLGGSKLFQQDAAIFLKIRKDTRTFRKIWSAFREMLTPEERARLPKRGEKKKDRQQDQSSDTQQDTT